MGFFDWIIQLTDQAQAALNAVVIFAACIMVLFVWLKSKAIAATLIAAIVAGVVIWLVSFGGIQFIADLANNTL
ncbi:hypothetical protein [Agrococcus casei]|uniref:Uncharacterized protein n=1 Tax=Agrococcus casei LMG 22410 TaxID=1255656 RepID=A0A1R4FIH3_9MICO|nr:hypothetical protein [Agrococcus casei]SJM55790.1 hypothetical protein CZ674_04705 [Agrococcus casei LMG 22410]